ncbi:MAG: flavin reductase [Treponema sp.]|nr:flavin reductase [Treponema sp.]
MVGIVPSRYSYHLIKESGCFTVNLVDCPVQIECTVAGSIVTGSHEMFIGKIEAVFADGELVDGEGKIDFSRIDFL